MLGHAITARASRPQTEAATEPRHLPALDGVRGVAILLVLLVHLTNSSGARTSSRVINLAITLRGYGWVGVDLFFVLSGFLITGILFETVAEPGFFVNFYARRFLRIFPLYYGALVVLLLLSGLLGISWHGSQLILLAYLQNIPPWLYRIPASVHRYTSHFWSLAVEEQFYLVWPCIVYFVRDRRRLILTALLLALVAPILRTYALFHELGIDFSYVATPCRMDTLLIGAALSLSVHGPLRSNLLRAAPAVFWAGAACLGIRLLLHPGDIDPHSGFNTSIGYTLLAIIFAALIANALRPRSWMQRFFKIPTLRWFGKYSYGIYVIHFIVVNTVLFGVLPRRFIATHLHSKALGVVGGALPTLIVTVFLAWLSFRFFESPFLRLKKYFGRRGGTPREGFVVNIACKDSDPESL